MLDEKVTREKLIECARQEFLEKGYLKASLRGICQKAGVTTGALYFFFRNKEDLLSAVAGETLRGLNQIIRAHFSREIDTGAGTALTGDASEDIQSAKEIMHYLYRHYDMVLFLLTKSQGSSYEDIAGQFADVLEQHYDQLTEQLAARLGIPKPDRYLLHWASHMQIDAFVHLLTHVEEEEKAMVYIERIVSYLVAGWVGAFVGRKENPQPKKPDR